MTKVSSCGEDTRPVALLEVRPAPAQESWATPLNDVQRVQG